MKQPISEVFNGDCMEYMAGLPDKFFDLVIADPPYGIGASEGYARSLRMNKKITEKKWDNSAPAPILFKTLKDKSKNQIIWGGNYFSLGATRCFLIWDKENAGRDFADCEFAWTSFDLVARIFKYRVATDHAERFHPTQKPVALYKWLLKNYAKPGDKIFDPMMGSQSSRIAAWDMGFDFWGCELDADYFEQGCARFEKHRANKTSLFDPQEMYFEQTKLKI